MNTVFADTSYYVALLNERDQLHRLALKFALDKSQQVMVSEFVLLELGNSMYQTAKRGALVQLIERMRLNPHVIIEPAAESLFEKALSLFEMRPDKEWSLTDCSSFVLMHEYGIEAALTADHHFEQAGFTVLLK